jgi:hypothetical protein
MVDILVDDFIFIKTQDSRKGCLISGGYRKRGYGIDNKRLESILLVLSLLACRLYISESILKTSEYDPIIYGEFFDVGCVFSEKTQE